MNYKFFGNSLDLFKYDILTTIGKIGYKLNYIPMITKPEEKQEDPKYKLYETGYKNTALYEFIQKVNNEFLTVEKIDIYFKQTNISYKSFFSIKGDKIDYFDNKTREEYFSQISLRIDYTEKSIIFIDPDVGIDIGISRRVRSNRNLYLKKEELDLIYKNTSKDNFICFFQHLGNYRISLEQRKKHLTEIYGENIIIVAYERILASMIFVFKEQQHYVKVKKNLIKYIEEYKEMKHFEKLKLI